MVVVTSLFNLVISSFPDNMLYHVWTWLLIYRDGSNNVVQVCSFIKPWTVCSNMHEQACQQPCLNWPAQPCSSLSTTMFKPVNNYVQAGQLNRHVQACQQPCSRWPAQPCSSLSTTRMFKMASSTMFKPVNKLCVFTCDTSVSASYYKWTKCYLDLMRNRDYELSY